MRLSTAQQHLHWALWKRAKAKLMPGRETWTKHEENERRHALYIQALGDDKSLTEMDNEDFDLVLGALRAIIDPSDLNAQLHALNGQRKRLMFGIGKLTRSMGADEFYVAGIVRTMNAEGKLGGSDLEELHPKDLTKVMIALRKHEARGCVHAHISNTQRVAHLETAPVRSPAQAGHPEPCLASETSEPDPF